MQHYNTVNVASQHLAMSNETTIVDTRIEDGKLLYERRWSEIYV